MEFSYKTIKESVTDILLKEKGSKFLGFAFPVSSEEEIKAALEEIKSLHPKATHHCYAYRLGLSGDQYRANDDGEPSGTAGLPIYNQLLANEVTNCLVIIVRYYGGTKLGVSGLIKAYKESAKFTLESCQIVEKDLERTVSLRFSFSEQNTAFTIFNRYNARVQSFDSQQECKIIATIRERDYQAFENALEAFPGIILELPQ